MNDDKANAAPEKKNGAEGDSPLSDDMRAAFAAESEALGAGINEGGRKDPPPPSIEDIMAAIRSSIENGGARAYVLGGARAGVRPTTFSAHNMDALGAILSKCVRICDRLTALEERSMGKVIGRSRTIPDVRMHDGSLNQTRAFIEMIDSCLEQMSLSMTSMETAL